MLNFISFVAGMALGGFVVFHVFVRPLMEQRKVHKHMLVNARVPEILEYIEYLKDVEGVKQLPTE